MDNPTFEMETEAKRSNRNRQENIKFHNLNYDNKSKHDINGLTTQPNLCECSKIPKIEDTSRKWVILGLFCAMATISAMHWFHYSIISNVIQEYYGVSGVLVDWSAEIIMIINSLFIFPAILILEKIGLRNYVLLGSYLTVGGVYLKQQAVDRELFWLALIGQLMIAFSQVFLLNVPSQIAATWFKTSQVNLAAGCGVLGSQLGLSFGIFLPPFIVNADNPGHIGKDMTLLSRLHAYPAIITAILITIFFKERPEHPPSLAEAKKRVHCNIHSVHQPAGAIENGLDSDSIKKPSLSPFRYLAIFKNFSFVALFIAYGLNCGLCTAIAVVLNPMMLPYFPGQEKFIGIIGSIIMLAGLVGSFVASIPLNLTGQYKIIHSTFFVFVTAFLALFSLSLVHWESEILLYITSGVFGFFHTGLYTVGFEFSAELTYPQSAGISCGFLNGFGFLLGVVFTSIFSWMIAHVSVTWVCIVSVIIEITGFVFSLMIKSDLRRTAAGKTSPEVES